MFFLFNLKYVSTSGGLYSSDVPLYFFIENYLLFFIDFSIPKSIISVYISFFLLSKCNL